MNNKQTGHRNVSGYIMKTGIELVADERKRQVEVEGWTAEHDKQHGHDELAIAGACYAMAHTVRHQIKPKFVFLVTKLFGWPFSEHWWRPSPDNRKKELIKAAALIVAAIDRLQMEE